MRATIDFIEHQRHPPREWPDLKPFIFDLSLIFETDKDQKYAILIFEPSDSYLGRKVFKFKQLVIQLVNWIFALKQLILDFSEYIEEILLHRTTYEKNPDLFKKFNISSSFTEPELYVIINSHDSNKKREKLETFVNRMSKNEIHNTGKQSFS
jgi:hypothetical protein